jgi:hypothetical protein
MGARFASFRDPALEQLPRDVAISCVGRLAVAFSVDEILD